GRQPHSQHDHGRRTLDARSPARVGRPRSRHGAPHTISPDFPPQPLARGAVARRCVMPTVALPTHSLERPAWLPPDVWPFDTTRVDVDGVAIAVADVGTGPVL